MRKKITCAILAMSSLCSNVFAATDIQVDNNKIIAEVDIDAGKWGTLIVTKSGMPLDDENILVMKQAMADENGKAVFNFAMPNNLEGGVNGKYDLHIKNGTNAVRTESMYYTRPDDRDNVIDALKNEEDIKAILENADNEIPLKALGVHIDYYNDFKEIDIQNGNSALRDLINEQFTNGRSEDMSGEEIANLLNGTLIIQKINSITEGSIEVIEKLGFSFEGIKYTDAERETKSFVCEYIYANKPYSKTDEVEKAYETANILNVISKTRFDKMEETIERYAEALVITEKDEYKKYIKASKKNSINEDIVAALKNKKLFSVEELLLVIEKATKDNKSESSAGGGGGTLGSSSNSLATIPVVNNRKDFNDIDDVIWAKTAISSMAEKGIVSGDEKGNFNPNKPVKREEFVKMLVVVAGAYNANAKCAFDDVISDAWYSAYVASAYNNNMVYGTSESKFGVGTNITRQDMAVMCYRAAQNANKLNKVRESVQFADEAGISDYAKEAVKALYETGAINGVGGNLFDAVGTATRAQAAVMIYNLFVR